MISVFINGAAKTFESSLSIADLIVSLGLTGKRVAIECNSEIVPRSTFSTHLLSDGDKVEVVVAVGGG